MPKMNTPEENLKEEDKTYSQEVKKEILEKDERKTFPLEPTRYGDWEKKGRTIDF